MFYLSKKSMKLLKGVHPDLVQVVQRAIEITALDFGVSCGLRTKAEQYEAFSSGASATMRSKHLPQYDTWSHAVDLFVLVDGNVTWEHKYFRKVVQAMFTAAIELGVQIEAGALWCEFLDSPHFQLSSKHYYKVRS